MFIIFCPSAKKGRGLSWGGGWGRGVCKLLAIIVGLYFLRNTGNLRGFPKLRAFGEGKARPSLIVRFTAEFLLFFSKIVRKYLFKHEIFKLSPLEQSIYM